MKTFKLIVIVMLLFFAGSAQAQISVHLNLGTPPQWGPVGYTEVRYYYLPDVEAYYDIPTSLFIYYNGYSWVRRSSLPTRYRNYDLYNGYKVPMSDYRGDRPYSNFRKHKTQYARGYRGQEQHSIGQRPDRENFHEGSYSRDRSKQKISRGNSRNSGQDKGKIRNRNTDRAHGNGKKN